jgi:hypothetical protein
MELSGIVGDTKLLGSPNIDVVVDNPNVGENLQHRPMSLMSFGAVDDGEEGFETIDAIARQVPDAISAAMDAYITRKRGPFSQTNSTPRRTSLSLESTPKPVNKTYRPSSKISHQSSQPSQQAKPPRPTPTTPPPSSPPPRHRATTSPYPSTPGPTQKAA